MSIEVLKGLPGSGKSSRLIDMVNTAIAHGEPVLTFACSESPLLANRPGLSVHHRLASRRPGVTCPLNHFVSAHEAGVILSHTPPATLAAFEEAQYFSPSIVQHWREASARGVKILISTPSAEQLHMLKPEPTTETVMDIKCQRCGEEPASTFIVLPENDSTMALCTNCREEMTNSARADLLDRLEKQPPHAGRKAIYQPIDELPECADWEVVRPDSKARADLMLKTIEEMGLLERASSAPPTYLDIGCNTGYFCDRMRRAGFFAEGVDVVKTDIAVAKTLDAYFRKGNNRYVTQDAYAYLQDTQDQLFDVTSAFAVFQWLMIQTTVERGITCLEWLFAKTKELCFLEMGYSAEPQYKERLKANIDREWVRQIMEEKGGFAEVRIFDTREHGLMFGRDLFVGIKNKPAVTPQS